MSISITPYGVLSSPKHHMNTNVSLATTFAWLQISCTLLNFRLHPVLSKRILLSTRFKPPYPWWYCIIHSKGFVCLMICWYISVLEWVTSWGMMFFPNSSCCLRSFCARSAFSYWVLARSLLNSFKSWFAIDLFVVPMSRLLESV